MKWQWWIDIQILQELALQQLQRTVPREGIRSITSLDSWSTILRNKVAFWSGESNIILSYEGQKFLLISEADIWNHPYILAEMSMKISTLKIQNLIKRINDPSTIKKKNFPVTGISIWMKFLSGKESKRQFFPQKITNIQWKLLTPRSKWIIRL